MTNLPVFPQGIAQAAVAVLPADTTSKKTIRTGSTNGDKIENISITSTDTSARVFNIYLAVSGTDYLVGTINVPIAAGSDAAVTPAVSMLEATAMLPWIRKDQNGRPYLYLANGTVLKVACQTTVTTAKEIDFVAHIGTF